MVCTNLKALKWVRKKSAFKRGFKSAKENCIGTASLILQSAICVLWLRLSRASLEGGVESSPGANAAAVGVGGEVGGWVGGKGGRDEGG